MMLPLFAFLDDAKQSIMQFVHNCLLVAGAFLVGYILGGLIGWALGKWALKQESPQTLKQMGRPVGGLILAFIVALLVFSGMGKRWGPGGDGAGTPSDTGNKERDRPEQPFRSARDAAQGGPVADRDHRPRHGAGRRRGAERGEVLPHRR